MRTVISDLQALRNTLDASIEQDTASRNRQEAKGSDGTMLMAYWQGKIDGQNSIRKHLQAIIQSEISKVYGDHVHTQACYGIEHGDLVCGK